ncbi:MAG: bifunctional diaminohydroxyphosphoribosylaminopyrimidine deaminase/5-amino-6-(5-phosphoribosylamino)uracil reductase RibD [Desulfuromonas sp.]|nr:MAG: bifunctional diaminohydroxyphosphoribosylaminopyrimidine deaminase/5-amino-6-(5-phosphoribosylamino)uracil reductase RibD [Desulfuromonas sp.]
MASSTDEKYLQMALELAGRGLGRTAPNPPVGAVLVRDGEVVGSGFHPKAGQPHAEIFALRQAGVKAAGADLFVTLEPCCHQGRTGPCTEALIAAGVRRVVIGAIDPNPQVAGQGLRRLQESGMTVRTAVLEEPCRRLIAPFAKHVTTGRPFVIFKAAMTMDGQTATSAGESQWISCAESRLKVHQLRDQVDAIMVGSKTVITDNPRLTTRLPSGGRDPVRIVIDSRLATSPMAAVYNQSSPAKTLLMTGSGHSAGQLADFRERGIEVHEVAVGDGHLDLVEVMERLGRLNLQAILLEGGSALAGAMLRCGLVDRVMLFVAPLLLGGCDGSPIFSGPGVENLVDAFRLIDVRVTVVGEDILLEGEVAKCSPD